MITVWGRNTSINVQKVMWMLAEIGQEATRLDVGGPYGGTDEPAFVALNPNRTVPVLKDGDLVMWESNAIVRYLGARYAAGSIWPENPARRAASDKWMDWASLVAWPAMLDAFWILVRTPEAERDMDRVARSAAATAEKLALVDRVLADRPFLGGDSIDIADIALGPFAWRLDQLAVPNPDLPHFWAWYERLKSRPGYRSQVMIPLR